MSWFLVIYICLNLNITNMCNIASFENELPILYFQRYEQCRIVGEIVEGMYATRYHSSQVYYETEIDHLFIDVRCENPLTLL